MVNRGEEVKRIIRCMTKAKGEKKDEPKTRNKTTCFEEC